MKIALLIVVNIILISTAPVHAEPQKKTDLMDWPGLTDQARKLFKAGQYDDAIQVAKKALEAAEKDFGPDTRSGPLIVSLRNLADCYFAQGQYELAARLYERALDVWYQLSDTIARNIAFYPMIDCLNNLATIYFKWERYTEAEEIFDFVIPILIEQYGPDAPYVVSSLRSLFMACIAQLKVDKAILICEQLLAIQEKALGPNHVLVADSLDMLAKLLVTQKEYDRSESLFKRAIAIKEKTLGPDHPELSSTLENFAFLYRHAGRAKDAEEIEERIERIKNTRR